LLEAGFWSADLLAATAGFSTECGDWLADAEAAPPEDPWQAANLREMRRAASIAPILKWTLLPNLLAFTPYPLIFFLDDLSRTFGSLWLPAFMILCMLLHSGSGFLIKRRIFGTARLAKGMVCDACLYPQPASVASEGGRCPECGRTWTEGELPNRWQQAALYGRARWP
jgi:hypothetical protein